MKQIKTLKLVLFVLSICLFTSCSDDDSLDEKTNHIKVNSKSFVITNATVIDEDSFHGVTEYEIIFASAGITIEKGGVNGKGDVVTLALTSNKINELTAGEYIFSKNNNTGLSLDGGVHFFNYDSTLGDNQSGDVDFESGSVSVAVENNKYTITFNLVDEAGDTVTGYYNGVINGLNNTSKNH